MKLKVLFVCSGNTGNPSVLVKRQADSLVSQGIDVDFFLIRGKGIAGYLKNILQLKKYLKLNKYDIIHSHYSLSSFVASLAGARHMVVSLMGSDVKSSKFYVFIIHIFKLIFRWEILIVKSYDMMKNLGLKDAIVIPNGVDLFHFKPKDKLYCQKQLEWDTSKKHFLFASNPIRPVKNFKLIKKAFNILNNEVFKIHVLDNVPHKLVPIYMNASDAILLSSLWEGSPNVVKEAMACNCQIVSTDVGDVRGVIENTKGCFISTFEPEDVAKKINLALQFTKQTNGREKIIELGLDSNTIAKRIIEIYNGEFNEEVT